MTLALDDPTYKALLQTIDQRSPSELAILQVLTVADEPLKATEVLLLCTQAGRLLSSPEKLGSDNGKPDRSELSPGCPPDTGRSA